MQANDSLKLNNAIKICLTNLIIILYFVFFMKHLPISAMSFALIVLYSTGKPYTYPFNPVLSGYQMQNVLKFY